MAFFNSVRLYGRVLHEARVYSDLADRPIMAQMYIAVLKSKRNYGDKTKSISYETPLIMTYNPLMIAKLSSFKKNDIIDVAGYFSTLDMNKKVKCAHCGEVYEKPGVVSYVNPTFIALRQTDLDDDESLKAVIDNAEISNTAELFGRLTEDPAQIVYKPGTRCTKYTLEIKRLAFFEWEPPERTVDYPVVRVYGDLGAENMVALHGPSIVNNKRIKGSEVKIDGFLQTRKVRQRTKCPFCDSITEWPDTAMECVPFNVEYARDCDIPGATNS